MSTAFLIVIALGLIFTLIIQIARTADLISVLRGEGAFPANANKVNPILLLVFMILFLAGSVWSAWYYSPRYLPAPASEHGHLIDEMFNLTLFFTGIVFILTHILLFWFAYKYRAKEGKVAYYYPHNNKLEIIWTAVPAVVLTVLVAKGIDSWMSITAAAPADSLTVEVVAEQFKWNIRYPGKDGKLGKRDYLLISAENPIGVDKEDPRSMDDFEAQDIYIPVNKPVLFKLGAKDVLHSFYLPHFRVKMDCVPGIPTQFWMTPTMTTEQARIQYENEEFDFELACTELCGSSHWNMRKRVVVLSESDYSQWLAEQIPTYNPSIEQDSEPSTSENTTETTPVEGPSAATEVKTLDLITSL